MAEQVSPAHAGAGTPSGTSAPLRQRGQEQLAELKQLYDTAPVGLGFIDTELRYVRLNEQLAAINGPPVADHLGRTMREIIPEIAPEVEQIHRRVIESGEPVLNLEIHGSTPAAADRDFLVSYSPVRSDDGSVHGVSVVVQDITDRKQAEAALQARQEEERRFSEQLTALHEVTNHLSTLDSLDDLCRAAVELGRSRLGFDRLGIWFVEDDRASATGMFGIDESGRLRDERGSRVPVSPHSLAGQVLATQRPFALRQETAALDHRAEPVGRGSHAIAGLWNGAEVIGFISTDNLLLRQPISERQCKLLTLYASALGHMCALKRLQEELRRRAEALTAADHSKDEFLALLAHELRNPLAPVIHAVDLIQERLARIPEGASGVTSPSPDTPRGIRDPVLVIDRQVRRMARLVDDLLDVSRITQGRVELRKEQVDLHAVVRRTLETCLPFIEACRHDFTVSLPPGPVWLEADPVRLEQILANLLNNAAKYTEPGGRIWFTAEIVGVGDMPGGADPDRAARSLTSSASDPSLTSVPVLVLRVRDTGMGLAPDLLTRVFELFTQADRSLDRSQGGLGIGLTLVQRLAELHGGSVHAESAGPGQGSEFVVRLPVLEFGFWALDCAAVVDHGSVLQIPQNASAQRAPEIQTPKPTRVLVVDDNVDAASILSELLTLWGHEVRVAHDGRQALEAVDRFQPDVVLLDIGLPQMDGYEVARRLGERPERDRMRLVAVTGYGQEEDRRKSQAAGFDDHLVKPVDPSALQQLLAAPPSAPDPAQRSP